MIVEDSDDRLTPVWRNVVTDLAPTLSQQQRAWLSLTQPVGLLGTTALLAAPTDFAKEAIERILREPITTALSGHLNLQISLAVTVSDEQSVGPLTSSTTATTNGADRQRVVDRTDRFAPGSYLGDGGLVEPTRASSSVR